MLDVLAECQIMIPINVLLLGEGIGGGDTTYVNQCGYIVYQEYQEGHQESYGTYCRIHWLYIIILQSSEKMDGGDETYLIYMQIRVETCQTKYIRDDTYISVERYQKYTDHQS